MTLYFVTRHPGAREWARRLGLEVDVWLPHLDPVLVQPGDVVAGILPVHLAAIVCEQGGRYLNLSMNLPVEARGRELSAEELERFGARLEEYAVRKPESGLT
jgi:CRISPR-associated protein Csx16